MLKSPWDWDGLFLCLLSKILVEGRKNQGWNPYRKCHVNSLSDQSCLTFHRPAAEVLLGVLRTQAKSKGYMIRQITLESQGHHSVIALGCHKFSGLQISHLQNSDKKSCLSIDLWWRIRRATAETHPLPCLK